MVFASDALNAREHINFLPGMQFSYEIWRHTQVVPSNIKLVGKFAHLAISHPALMILLEISQFPVQVSSRYLLNDIVLSLLHVNHDSLLSLRTVLDLFRNFFICLSVFLFIVVVVIGFSGAL